MSRIDSIVDYIKNGATGQQRVGLELEHFICNEEYEMISYPEMAECLEEICEKAGGKAYRLDGRIYGIFCMDYNISIEPACQLEISIYPKESPQEIKESYDEFRAVCEPIFFRRGYRLCESGVFPLVENGDLSPDKLGLIPKERYQRMDEHFKTTGAHGRYMMRATASTQVCIDFSSEEDAMKKLRVLQKLAPVLSLIAENKSGIGTGSGWKKHLLRNQIWRDVDPARCGYLENSVSTGYSFEKYAQFLEAHSDIQFREADISKADMSETDISNADIEHLISVYFPMVRLKKYLEFRAADSMPAERAIGFAMLIKNLMYEQDILDALDERLGHVESVDEIYEAENEIFERGYHAVVYGKHVMEWMKDLFSSALGCVSGEEREAEREYIKKAMPLPLLNYEYKELVVGNESDHRESAFGIRDYLMQSTAKYHNRVVKTLYLPKLFTPREITVFDQAIKALYGIFDKIYAEFETNKSYRELFGFSQELNDLILREKRYSCNIPIARIDIFYNEETGDFKFCEFNTDGTSAMNEDRELNIAFSQTKAYREFAKAHRLSSFELFDTWVDEVLKLYEEFAIHGASGEDSSTDGTVSLAGVADLPNVAIVDFMENATENEFKIFVERFEQRGCRAEICDIRNIRWDGDKCMTPSGMEVDVIYRRAVTSDILSHMEEVPEFIAAAKSNRVCLLGDFRTQIAHNKVLYKILHRKETLRLLTKREQVFIQAHVPYTIALDEMFAAGNEELCADVLAHKDNWIIKPEDSYGSKGVHAGVEHENQDEWAQILSENRGKKYILQAFNNPYELLNIDFTEEDYRWVNASNLTGLFVYNEKLRGAYSRISFVKMISTQYSEMSSPTVLVE